MILFVYLTLNLMLISFYEFLNKQRPHVNFTFEKQQNDQISILDILIKKNGENLSTTIFCNTKVIGVITKILSFTQISY